MKRTTISQGTRLAVQIASFILLPGLFVDALSGIHVIFSLATGASALDEASAEQLVSLALLVISSLVVGRVFCGWMCAFGTMQDLLRMLGKKVFDIRLKVGKGADRVLKYAKYLVLALTIGVIWTGIVAVPESWSPWEAFASLAAWPPDFAGALARYGIGLVALLAIMVGSLFVERLFCRYLCPVGALLSIVSLPRPGRIEKPRQACGRCHACTASCAMGIDLTGVDVVRSGECIDCLKCVSVCPKENATFVEVKPSVTPLVTTAAAATIVGLSYVGSVATPALFPTTAAQATTASATTVVTEQAAPASTTAATTTAAASTTAATTSAETAATSEAASTSAATTTSSAASTAAASTSASGWTDGTYTGTGSGHRGTTTISVTISGGQITDITTVSTQDDAKYYDRAFSTVTSEIISSQSASVDAVSGATHSSDGIMQAVASALAKA